MDAAGVNQAAGLPELPLPKLPLPKAGAYDKHQNIKRSYMLAQVFHACWPSLKQR